MILCCAATAQALDPSRAITQYVRDAWTARDGAPAGTITGITQTPNGYLWLGTQAEGLVRFDGVAFARDSALDTLFERRIDRIISLTCGRDGALWVGTTFGVARFKDGRWTEIDRGKSSYAFGLHESPDGTLWYATNWEGVVSAVGDNVTHLPLRGKPMFLTSDTGGNLWAGGYEGLWRLSGRERRSYSTADGLPDRNITCVFGDRAGNVWVGTQQGLTLLRDDKVAAVFTTREGLSSDSIKTAFVDRDGVLWVGTTNAGLSRRRGARFETLSRVGGLTNNRVTALFEDRERSLWIGTANGLNRLRDASVLPIGESEGLTPGEPASLAEGPDGSVYVSTGMGGLNQVKDGIVRVLRSGAASGFDGPLFVDPDGGVWSGHQGGLAHIGEGRRVNYEVAAGSIVRSITRDAVSLIFATTEGDVFRLVDGRAEPYRLADGSQLGRATLGITFVRMMHVARDGTLWLATAKGGVIAVRNGVARQVAGGDLIQARSVFEDERGVVWCGTEVGIVRAAQNGSAAIVTEKQGLPQNRIYYVLSDKAGRLWMSCARGIFYANRQDVEEVVQGKAAVFRVETFGVNEGMRSSEAASDYQPAACVARDGRLWFAMAEGVVVIDPSRIQKNKLPPPVLIESVAADGTELPLGSEVVVPAGTNRLEIHYNGLSLLVPHRVRFNYMLEPFESAWVKAGPRRMASYTNLWPRRYRFRMIAFNNDDLQSDTEATLVLRVLPRWYQRWWSLSLAVLLICGLAAGVYLWRVRALEARQRELTQRVDERTRDLRQEVAERKRTEEKLHGEIAERQRAEEEARGFAEKLAFSNTELTERQQRIEREIQERRHAEAEAVHERDLLRALMDNTPDLIYFKDKDSRYTRVNKACAHALGVARPDDALGKTDHDFRERDFALRSQEDERALLTTGRPLLGKEEYDARHGRWYLTTKVPLKEGLGQVVALVGTSKDITEHKQAEKKLEEELTAFLAVVDAAAHGDLTRRGAQTDGTLGRITASVNQMLDGFSAILREARDAVLSVSSSSSEILAAATQIAKGAEYGSDQVHSTLSAVEEMASSMAQVSRHAEQSATSARQLLEHVQEGETSMNATALGMTRIDGAVSETAGKMRLLEDRSKEIFEIIALIEAIASQSNLLSLNAAIEAAHAGEAGRGFGVVAEEIRRLADRSTESTKQATTIVEGIVDETRLVIAAMAKGIREVQTGRELSQKTQASLQAARSLVARSADLSEQISLASREQTRAAQAASQAMQTVANVTEQSSAGAKEASKAVRQLVDLSEQLTRAIARFRIDQSR